MPQAAPSSILRQSARRRPRPSFASLRIRDLCKLFRARYGSAAIPQHPDALRDIETVAHHLARLPGNPVDRIRSWVELRAEWMSLADLRAIIDSVTERPRHWTADQLAWRLKVIEQDRAALKLTTIGAVDLSKAERAKRRKQRAKVAQQRRRRQQGTKPRAEYLAEQASKPKPWVELGISRRTYYRRIRTGTPIA